MNFKKVLVVDDIAEIREITIFYLQTITSVDVIEAKDGKEAIEILKANPDIQLIISDFNMPNGTGLDVFNAAKTYSHAPFILHTTDPTSNHEMLLHEPGFYFLAKPMDIDQFKIALKNITNTNSYDTETEEYVPVKLSLVKLMKETNVPIYLKISDKKYIKVLNKGSVSENFLSEKTVANDIRTLYIKKTDVHKYIDDYHLLIQNTLDRPELKKNIAIEQVLTTTELLTSVVETLHISEKIESLVSENIHSVTELAKDRMELCQIIEAMEKSDSNITAKQIVLLSMIATDIASSLHWVSDITSVKLTYAAILFDCYANEHNSQYLLDPKDHIQKAVKLAENWKSCPSDVSTIILQHHERPNGSGFPNNLDYHRIAPLSAVFIVAHDLAESILKFGKDHLLESWLFAKEKEYSVGNFKKAFDVIRTKTQIQKAS